MHSTTHLCKIVNTLRLILLKLAILRGVFGGLATPVKMAVR